MTEERFLKITDISSDGDTTEKIEMDSTCIYYGTPDNYTVEFDEIFAEDMKSRTVLRVKDSICAHLLRRGSINTELIIEKGIRHNSAYSTPYGELMVGITATDFISRADENGVYLKMNYTVDFYGDVNQTKEMTVEVGKVIHGRNDKT
ncbi:MAG: DUF1934 domain-containing protein [Ruminococcaceae bacterium]|nr:DUF1934 domain-containing protein [Oscillospiraceae bacterium]